MINNLSNTIKAFMLLVCFSFFQNEIKAQTFDNGIFFQALARDSYSNPAKDRKIYVQSTIIQSSVTGTKVLVEEFQVTTDASGVFGISIGKGTRTSGTMSGLNSVDWSAGPYFLNLQISITPVAPLENWNYAKDWIDLGTTSFGTVPYALHAKTVAGFDTKLNVSDTARMLSTYAKTQLVNTKLNIADTITLSNRINLKANASDVATNTANIVTNTNSIATNATNIATNTGNIAVNTSDISTLNTNVATNTANIANNTSDIALKANISSLATVATSGSYNDLSDKPSLPIAAANTLGGVKVGNNLAIDANGVLSSTAIPYAGATSAVNLGAYDLTVNGLRIGLGGSLIPSNVVVGKSAMNNNTTGANNIAAGFEALKSNTIGYSNAAFGGAALTSNTTGFYNTALGKDALRTNTIGLENTGVGLSSLYSNAGASYNTALGSSSLVGNTTGEYNTAVGRQAAGATTIGSNNVAVGAGALNTNIIGSSNTAIGRSADVSANNISNSTALGYGAIVTANNSIQLGNLSVTNVKTSGTVTAGEVTYPNAHGTNGQVLTTTGSGALTWATPASTANASSLTGIVSVANGGTGQTTIPGILTTLGLSSNNIAIGNGAGSTGLGPNANTVAIGGGAGQTAQGQSSIGIGYVAGYANQGANSLAIGGNAAQSNQGQQAVALGFAAGQNGQGAFSVALGAFAGNSQVANSIAINATGANLNPSNSGFYVNPVRATTATSSLLYYNTLTKEITSATGSFVDLTTAQTIAGVKTFSSNINVNGINVGRGNGNNDESLAVGAGAMGSSNVNGKRNTAIGYGAMARYNGTSWDNNTSVGYNNLPGMTSGSGNTSVGAESMMANATGTQNTSVGNQSLINTTGNDNIGIGKRSGQTITTGSQNTIVGTDADVATNNLNNATAIGYGANVAASNTIQLGNTSITNVKTSGAITAGAVTYPKVDGTNGQVLTSDGSGTASWQSTASFIHYVGENYGGGIVVAVWKTSGVEHGLIVAKTDASSGVVWSDITNSSSNATSLTDGLSNTNLIIIQNSGSTSAAKVADDFTVTDASGTFSDWYLPSVSEFGFVYMLKDALPFYGSNSFDNGNYNTSTESSANAYYGYSFSSFSGGKQSNMGKGNSFRVRAMRSY